MTKKIADIVNDRQTDRGRHNIGIISNKRQTLFPTEYRIWQRIINFFLNVVACSFRLSPGYLDT